VYPAVVVWDAATSVVVVVVQLWRQDHRFGWWLGFGASHATRVAGVSSVTPSVGNGTPHYQPSGNVKERQAASLGLLAEPAHDGVDVGFAPTAPSGIHLGGSRVAWAVWAGGDVEGPSSDDLFEFRSSTAIIPLRW